MYTKQTNNTDVATWGLPEGAMARLGRGCISKSMAFSPDGALLVVATALGCWWYDLATLVPRALWDTERGMVSAISFSHDGQWIATGNSDGIVKIWDSRTLQCIAKIDVPANSDGDRKSINALIFSPDGESLAAAGCYRNAVYAWQSNTDTPITLLSVDMAEEVASAGTICPIAFSPDSTLLAYKSAYKVISVLCVETGGTLMAFSEESPRGFDCYALTFSPCGRYLAASNRKNGTQVWNVHSGTLEMPLTIYGSIQVVPKYMSDGTLRVAGFYENEVVIWDAAHREKIDAFEYLGKYRGAACFSTDGKRLALTNRCGELYVWSEAPSSSLVSLPGHLPSISSLTFLQKGDLLISGTWGRSGILFWNVARRQLDRTFPSVVDDVLPCANALSPSEKLLATSPRRWGHKIGTHQVGTIKIWDITSGSKVAELTGHKREVYALAFSPTGGHLISICRERVILWETERWKKQHSLVGHIDTVRAVAAFHPDGTCAATASRDGLVFLWDVKRGEQLLSFPTTTRLDPSLYKGTPQAIERIVEQQELEDRPIRAIAFSPCGTLIAGGMQGEIRIWDVITSEPRMAIVPPQSCQRQFALAFSPSGDYLASGAWWQEGQEKVSIRLWRVATGENIATFWGHPTDIQDLAFSPDGSLLASGSFDGTILLWDVTPYLQQNEKS